MIVSIRMTEEERNLAEAYARLRGLTLSETIKRALFDEIEEEYDTVIAQEAKKAFDNDPETYTLDQIKEMFKL